MERARISIAVAIGFFLVVLTLPVIGFASDKEIIEITYGSPYGTDSNESKVDKAFIAKVEKETGGRVRFKAYWGGSVTGGRDAVQELQDGVTDMAFLNPAVSKSGLALTKALYILLAGTNEEIGGLVFRQLVKEFPQIEADYKGLKVLCWSGSSAQLITRRPVRTVADIKGMRMRVVGDMARAMKRLGVEGENTPASQVYIGLQKGLLDGTIAPMQIVNDLKLAEVAKYVTLIDFYRVHSGSRFMNLKSWNKLPVDIKKVFEDNIDWYSQQQMGSMAKANEAGTKYAKAQGVTIIPISKQEMEKFYAPIRAQAEEEAKELDKQGHPGTKILNRAQQLIKQYGSK